MTFKDFLETVLPLLFNHTIDRVDKDTDIGHITAYWAGTVLRIDIKPPIMK